MVEGEKILMTVITLIPDQRYPTVTTLRIATVVVVVVMVQEKSEAEANEFRPQPEHEEVEDVCEVPLDQKLSDVAERCQEGYQGGI